MPDNPTIRITNEALFAGHAALREDAGKQPLIVCAASVIEAAAPALYRAWAESRVEPVARLMYEDETGQRWDDAGRLTRERQLAIARIGLGLEVEDE